ncbi:hypothetical protein N7457_006854 [Penicillium paradoxum]|uniref:uncharacterized protein n=1 Tax=Penicillium paradoxum TaxID=176176 RepID=UPI002548995B|nr:uncharacterized protein N7457_006854 [Penicillium paradoxum]KAJ5779134.1 hypothetical protein N7457_006854 [Penicillium paradoxum]
MLRKMRDKVKGGFKRRFSKDKSQNGTDKSSRLRNIIPKRLQSASAPKGAGRLKEAYTPPPSEGNRDENNEAEAEDNNNGPEGEEEMGEAEEGMGEAEEEMGEAEEEMGEAEEEMGEADEEMSEAEDGMAEAEEEMAEPEEMDEGEDFGEVREDGSDDSDGGSNVALPPSRHESEDGSDSSGDTPSLFQVQGGDTPAYAVMLSTADLLRYGALPTSPARGGYPSDPSGAPYDHGSQGQGDDGDSYPPLPPSEGSHGYTSRSDGNGDGEEGHGYPSDPSSDPYGRDSQGQSDDSDGYPPLPPSEDSHGYTSRSDSDGNGEEGDGYHSDPSSDPYGRDSQGQSDDSDGYPPLPPSEDSHGYTSRSDSEEGNAYPPLPSSEDSHGYTTHSNSEEGNAYPPFPPSNYRSHGNAPGMRVFPMSGTNWSGQESDSARQSNAPSSSEGSFHSARTHISRTGITPAMSEAGLNSQNNSPTFGHDGQGDADDEWGSDNSEEGHVEMVEHVEPNEETRGRKRQRTPDDEQGSHDAEHMLFNLESSGSDTSIRTIRGGRNVKRARPDSPLSRGQYISALDRSTSRPDEDQVAQYRARGARYQAWIDDPDEPNCPIPRTTVTLDNMLDPDQPRPWEFLADDIAHPPLHFGGGETDTAELPEGPWVRYRYTNIAQLRPPEDWTSDTDGNAYVHRTTRGVLVAESIFRDDGLHWNEVAQAVYESNYRMNTLNYIVFLDIMNEETGPYIRYELYPNLLGILWSHARDHPAMIFEHGEEQYQELLGTRLGRAAASLVLGAYPRGTVRIARIVTWANATSPQMRFELEPAAVAPAA